MCSSPSLIILLNQIFKSHPQKGLKNLCRSKKKVLLKTTISLVMSAISVGYSRLLTTDITVMPVRTTMFVSSVISTGVTNMITANTKKSKEYRF